MDSKGIAGFIFLSFLQLCINAQETDESIRDSVFLKNGNIISGVVLNPGSDNNIQIRAGGSSILYVSQSQIENKKNATFLQHCVSFFCKS